MLSSTFHVHATLKIAPILPQKSQEMQVVRTFCSSTAKTSTVTLIFLHYFNNNNASFQWQFYDQRRRKLYHTLLGHGRREKSRVR